MHLDASRCVIDIDLLCFLVSSRKMLFGQRSVQKVTTKRAEKRKEREVQDVITNVIERKGQKVLYKLLHEFDISILQLLWLWHVPCILVISDKFSAN